VAVPMWAAGTALGIRMGELLPLRIVSALSVALYGMFLAVIIPLARKSIVVAGLVAVSFLASWGAVYLPVIGDMSAGTRTIILTLVISSAAALLFPRKEEEGAQ
ncbi:MAG: branched-chain amino acid ABC transporter permease, partial [Oscillospiraceae bacterium]|nr:branched-chain amino acid ABC transporter permease [Oscillospiraceae bacterium]